MPDIKYTGAPTVTPEEARRTAEIPQIHEQYPEVRLTNARAVALGIAGGAVGQLGNTMETVGRSIHSLGNAVEGAGDKMWNTAVGLKQVEAETKVNNLNIKVSQDLIKRDEDFLTKSGEAANSEALAAKLTGDEKLRQDAKAQLTTDYERRLFDQQTTHTFILSARQSARHSGTETKNQLIHSYEAQLGIVQNQAAKATEDSDFNVMMDRAKAIYYNQLRYATGMDATEIENAYRIFWTKSLVGRAQSLATTNSGAALKMLEDNKDKIIDTDEKIYTSAYERIQGVANRDGARVIADRVQNEMRDAPLAEKRRRAEELADEYRKGNIELKDMAVRVTEAKHIDQKQDEKDYQDRSVRTVLDVAYGFKTKSGKKPPTFEEASAEPGFKEAFETITDPHIRKAVLDIINKPEDYPYGPQADAIFQKWDGLLRFDHKEETTASIAANPALINDLPIPHAMRVQLYNTWRTNQQSMKKSEGELKTEHGVSILKQNGYGQIVGKMSKPALAVFKSVLSSISEREEGRLKRRLTDEEWIKAGNEALNNTSVQHWYGKSEVPYYKTFDVTNTFKDVYLESHPGANQIEIQRAYNAYKLQKDLEAEEKRKTK